MTLSGEIKKISDNSIEVPKNNSYTAILGLNPSKGARSPSLWNTAYEGFSINTQMIAIDVSQKNFSYMYSLLKSDPNFLGGAIAAPHKEIAATLCNQFVTPEAKHIGAINCLFRNEEGSLCGTNTDGEGSLVAFESIYGDFENKRILILGIGGTGKAVAGYFVSRLQNSDQLILVSRSSSARKLSDKIKCKNLDWSKMNKELFEVDVIINCTTLGSAFDPGKSPIPKKYINKLRDDIFIYDVVYDPIETPLLSYASIRGLNHMNGLMMNLEQAVIGFQYAITKGRKNIKRDRIRLLMNR
jgi:shikimate dehydrogenase